MDLSTTLILAVAAILGMNQLIFRLPGWERRRTVFWSIQFLNLLVIIALLAVGLPGFHGATKVVNWVLGLLLIHHVITNNGRLTAALQAEGAHESADIEARRAQIKSALSRGSEE